MITLGLRTARRLATRLSPRGIGLGRCLRLSAVAVGIVIPAFFAHTLLAHRGHELDDAEEQVANTAFALRHHAARTIEVAVGRLQAIAAQIRVQRGSLPPEALHDTIREQLAQSHGLRNIFVTDRSGTVIAESMSPPRALDVRDRDYFRALREGPNSLAIGRTIVGRLSGTPVLPIALRLEGPDGTFAGIVQASLDVEAFQRVYDAIENGAGGLLSLWRADGTLLVRSPHAPELVGRTFPSDPIYGARSAAPPAPVWADGGPDRDAQVVALGFLDGYPLYVGAALTRTEILVPWYRLAIPQGALGGGLMLVLVCALLLLARETERRHAADMQIRLLAENATDIFVLGDRDLRPVYVSPAVRLTLGRTPADLIGTDLSDLIHPDDQDAATRHRTKLLNGGEAGICTARHRHSDGHYVWIETSASPVFVPANDRRAGFAATLRDVTARREAEDRVRHMALHDPLTDLPNRTLLHDRLDQAIAHTVRTRSPFAVLACDLDRFKAVNDSLGHQAGDALLRAMAVRMRGAVRRHDTVARLGGDEFAIVLTCLDAPCSVTDIADRLIAAVNAPVHLDGRTVEVGISIGYTVATEGDGDADELFKRADIALYEAKAAGRNTHRAFCPDTGARIADRGQIGLDMKEAVRRGEFHLLYQPVVDAGTGAVVSFEALMRWRHPLRGEVSPGEFIPLAEENGLIVPLGAWALREACREALTWPEALRVAVNISAIQFRGGLEEAVLSALGASGLPACRLVLEVTESVLMRDAETVLTCLHRLRALGVRIALDDFGTGYSSLSYLRRFPFDKIKIDRSFIRDISDPDAAAIVRAVVGIGERLGIGIVAEGVETAEQLALVQHEGCSQVQGFLFSRPLPPEEARAHVLAARAEAA